MINNRKMLTVIGDSTIDNKIWIGIGLYGNGIRTKLGIKRDSSKSRIKKSHRKVFASELSVVEHLTDKLPAFDVKDYSNDGFTTHDCLYGNVRDKVFGTGTFDLFPNTFFAPLEDGKDAISQSDYIVVSVGGNNVREFLQSMRGKNVSQREQYIQDNFESLFTTLTREYIELVTKIRALNPNAKLILMTQYYPSIAQNNYGIYPFMEELGRVSGLGDDSTDVIHALMQKVYIESLREIDKTNTYIADVTSSLNPFNNQNHTSQIEPSGVGGEVIANLLSSIINFDQTNLPSPDAQVFRLDPASKQLVHSSFNNWHIRHPHEFTDMACFNELKELTKVQKTLSKSNRQYLVCQRVIDEATKLLQTFKHGEVKYAQDIKDLKQVILSTRLMMSEPDNVNYQVNANNIAMVIAAGKPVAWKELVGALMILIGAAVVTFSTAAIVLSGGISGVGVVGGAALIASGATLFNSGLQKGMSLAVSSLSEMVRDERMVGKVKRM